MESLVDIRRWQVGIQRDGLLGFGNRQLVLAGADQGQTRQQSGSAWIAGVALRPRFQCPLFPFQIASEVAVVQGFDVEALDVAGSIAQLVGLAQALPRQRRLSQAAEPESHLRVGTRKLWIERDRTLEEWQSPWPDEFPHRGAVGLQRFERRRRHFLERPRMFLDGGERFSNPRSKARRNLTECAQYLFFPCRLRLLVGKDVAGRAMLRAQAEDVLTAEHRDRSFQDGGAGGPDAHALRNVGSQSRLRRLVHQQQGVADALIGDEAEKRGLLKLNCESLSQ